MTRDTQRTLTGNDDAAVFSALWAAAPFPELPFDAPAAVKAWTSEIDDPKRVYTIYNASRRNQFQLLVERYMIQLRHGCQAKNCTTPTCFTCRKRLSGKVPLRRYSPTSARTLACYLASQDNPEAGLCPYVSSLPVSRSTPANIKITATTSKSSDGSNAANGHASSSRTTTTTSSSPSNKSKSKVPLKASEIWKSLEDTYNAQHVEEPMTPDYHDHLLEEPKKDNKSFIQTLYNTFSMRMLEWLTPTGFETLQATYNQDRAERLHTESENIQSDAEPENKNDRKELSSADGETVNGNILLNSSSPGITIEPASPPRNNVQSKVHRGSISSVFEDMDVKSIFANGKAKAHEATVATSIDGTVSPNQGQEATQINGTKAKQAPLTMNGSAKPSTRTSDALMLDSEVDQDPPKTSGIIGPQSLRLLNIEIIEFLCDTLQDDGTAERHFLQPLRVNRSMRRLRNSPLQRSYKSDRKSTKRQWKLFIQQSLFYVLSDPERALKSFGEYKTEIDSHSLWYCMLRLTRVEPSLVFHSLWMAAEALYVPPPELDMLSDSANASLNTSALSSAFAARLLFISLTALIAAAPLVENPGILFDMSRSRSRSHYRSPEDDIELLLNYNDVFSDELALRLARRLFAAIPTQIQFSELLRNTSSPFSSKLDAEAPTLGVLNELLEPLQFLQNEIPPMLPFLDIERAMHEKRMPTLLLDWARTIMIQDWNGSPVVPSSGSFGGALATIAAMYERRKSLLLGDVNFHTEYFAERLDVMAVPVEWLNFVSNKKTTHLLNYPFLFRPTTLVSYFRAINFSKMSRAFELSVSNTTQVIGMSSPENLMTNSGRRRDLFDRLATAVSKFFVLKIRRESVLKDTFDQIWRRQEREFTRPLKVRLGEDDGEEGSDSGGVQQEFFRLAIAEALHPDAGLFTVDERTQMIWFQPGSPEPLWKFELIGVLFSLAVYNGLTLPVTFPRVLYQKLLDMPVEKLDHIADGWPDLCAGFTTLLEWDSSSGTVADVFSRTYEFSVDMFGEPISRDMSVATEWPGFGETSESNPTDAKMVTEDNRDDYVKDYITWLTDISVRPQYRAFEQGFFTVIDRRSVSLFRPDTLQSLIEGVQEISVLELKRYARYVGWNADHPVIKDFWKIVEGYNLDMRRKLLEFVTASDRVPVGGMSGLQFVVQRNGEGDTRLPSAYTCYGTLLLPEYNTQTALREKLGMALENAKGFGFA